MKRSLALALLLTMCCGCAQTAPTPTEAPTLQTTPPTEATQATPLPTTEATIPTPPETEPTEPEPTTLLGFLQIATQPVGNTMYVWGGGWNEEDTGAGTEATTIGLPRRWANYARQQFPDYDYKQTRYQIHNGLDCSGYLGWAVYNALETEDGRPGFVYPSTKAAKTLSELGLGDYIPAKDMDRWLPGDVMSMKGHCWICVGMCDDGSVLLLHASPPGVIFSGTKLPDGSPSEATALAEQIMADNYPHWYARYPDSARPHSYLSSSSAMRWYETALPDPENIREMSAKEVVDMLYPHT